MIAIAWSQALAVRTPCISFVTRRRDRKMTLFSFVPRQSLGAQLDNGSNIRIIDRWAEECAEALPLSYKTDRSGATILVTAGTPATLAAAAGNMTIPIVLVGVNNACSRGLVNTLYAAERQRYWTMFDSSEVFSERLELLRHWSLACTSLAVIMRDVLASIKNCTTFAFNASAMEIEALMLEATTRGLWELAFARLHGDRTQGHICGLRPLGPVKRAQIIKLAADSQLPVIYSFSIFAIERGFDLVRRRFPRPVPPRGGFTSLRCQGSHPADLPVEPPPLIRADHQSRFRAIARPWPSLRRSRPCRGH